MKLPVVNRSGSVVAIFLAVLFNPSMLSDQPFVAQGFGLHQSLKTGVTQSTSNTLTMRVGVSDLKRRKWFNDRLRVLNSDSSLTKETVKGVLFSPEAEELLLKSNWKLRRFFRNKMSKFAYEYGVTEELGQEYITSFGEPPTQEKRVELEIAAGKDRKAARAAAHIASVAAKEAMTAKVRENKVKKREARAEMEERRKEAAAAAKEEAPLP
mmetsp:Transcript_28884/g.44403  ORF Transcript_28884/g.44403 Transcript_28884/m.44403 type:complete len:211 (-) Transcript_28884:101-733(-)|eukprot:CAMPEP_0118695400 /NCGR_PEP_ID=MMETSP0800-20121206/13158_1 /TAXON_ID=210618 ORGANISM="Striatella unipunctata, Strain CCMP2910" /NCGR_SAMPLE_ID=MMETSP0800 /ASSEMBLY_ACC=CAM_ASM_000638 /LENGTH=210 /DNA_ID=CAMNT_0006594173 /DNA_START=51 /DNA_END=683 /DNA_ORIENTATION=+